MNLDKNIGEQSFDLLCHKFIGSGMSRDVYTSLLLPDCVIKVENGAKYFQNIMEWEVWYEVKGTEYEKWFAPCEFISANGTVLIQKRTEPIPEKRLPKKLPSFFCDFKKANYGLYKNKPVCHDYGLAYILKCGLNKKMQNIEWW